MATKLETLRANADARLDALIEQNSMNVPFDTLCAIDFDDHSEAKPMPISGLSNF